MGPSLPIIENLAILDYYEDLRKKGLKPQLAVFRNQRLIIYCKIPTSTIEKITHLFSHLFSDLLIYLGLLSLDLQLIKSLAVQVNEFCFDRAVKKQKLADITLQIKKLTQEKQFLMQAQGITQEELNWKLNFLENNSQ